MEPFGFEAIGLAINLFALLGLGSAGQVEALVDEGFDLVEAACYREAVETLSKALALDPDHVEALERRATAYGMLGEHDHALADLHKAASLAPNAAEIRAGLCATLSETDPSAALPHCDAAIRMDPEDSPSLNNRSTALSLLGRDDEALADLDRAVALAPDEFIFRSNRAISLIELGRFGDAALDADHALALKPNDPGMMLALARIAVARGDIAEARALVGSVLKRGSGHAEALATAGWVALAEGAFEAARDVFDLALARPAGRREGDLGDRVRWISLYGRGLARRRLGDPAGADEDLAAARSRKPSADRIAAAWGFAEA